MPDIGSILFVMAVMLFSSTISAATGFGAVVLALPLCSLVIDIKLAVPLLSLSSMVTCALMLAREHHAIDRVALRRIMLWVGVGFPLGNYGFHMFPMQYLEWMVGVFVTGVALHGLWRLRHSTDRRPWSRNTGRALLLGGGIMQGALSTGGPLVVTYAQQAIAGRGAFRATLYVVWLVFNAFFLTSYFISPSRRPEVLLLGVYCLPVLIGGMLLGQRLHRRASEGSFQVGVLVILLVSGLSLLIPHK